MDEMKHDIRETNHGRSLQVPCGLGCSFHIYPLGSLDPEEGRCGHQFTNGRDGDYIVCIGCGLHISGEAVHWLRHDWRSRIDESRAAIADKAGALRTELDEVLVENATLRRKIEKLERKRS